MMKKLCPVHMVAFVLVLVGALNWGLVGVFKFNLVNAILGGVPTVERIVYAVVGLCAIFMLLTGMCKKCGSCCKGGEKDCCKEGDKSCCGGGEKKM